MSRSLSYHKAGVDIDTADAAKRQMAKTLETPDPRVFNSVGAFASLLDGVFPGYEQPVLVMKTEEPGSKQKLAFEHGRIASICCDLINHLLNDIIVMGARPLYVQDCILCGKLDKEVVGEIVSHLAAACREQECLLTGGETSEQPGMLAPGMYMLVAHVIGIVEKRKVVDGSRIEAGDVVLAVASSGLHTNGYSLVRTLLDQQPELAATQVDDQSFLEAILVPHKGYYRALRDVFDLPGLHGMAHITGGGIQGNLSRILPQNVNAVIDLHCLQPPPLFRVIQSAGNIAESDMLRTFNMGVGMAIVAQASVVDSLQAHLLANGCFSYQIGEITEGDAQVLYKGNLH